MFKLRKRTPDREFTMWLIACGLMISALILSSLNATQAQVIRQSIGPISGISMQEQVTVFSCVAQPFQSQAWQNDGVIHRPGFAQSVVCLNASQELYSTAYPNPTNDNITLSWDVAESATQVWVYDLRGQVIFRSENTQSNSLALDCSNWNKGMYLAHIIQENKKTTIKFIKQ